MAFSLVVSVVRNSRKTWLAGGRGGEAGAVRVSSWSSSGLADIYLMLSQGLSMRSFHMVKFRLTIARTTSHISLTDDMQARGFMCAHFPTSRWKLYPLLCPNLESHIASFPPYSTGQKRCKSIFEFKGRFRSRPYLSQWEEWSIKVLLSVNNAICHRTNQSLSFVL